MVVIERGEKKFYMDNGLARVLEKKVIKRVKKKDKDWCCIVDGEEGAGKSVFAMQLGSYLDHDLDISRICFFPEEFKKAVQTAKKGQCVIFDEAFRGMSSRSTLKAVNKVIIELMMECRQKNLFIIVVLPTFFLLDKYVALWRARCLFHVYETKDKQGNWRMYDRVKKKQLYLNGKDRYSYARPKTSFRGHFFEQYVVDEEKYREKKRRSLEEDNDENSLKKDAFEQRNKILLAMKEHLQMKVPEIKELCEEYGVKMRRNAYYVAFRKAKEQLAREKT